MTALYTLALISQAFVISIYLPARIVDAVEKEPGESDGPQGDGYRLERYRNRNRFVAILGLAPVIVAWLSDLESSVTLILLVTGLYFFVQVAALVAPREVRSVFSVGQVVPQRVSRPLVVGAVVAYVAYVAASVIYQNESITTTWAKIQVVTLANAFFVLLVVGSLISTRRASTEESRGRRQQIGRSINVLAAISIGLSAYFFGKDVLAELDLAELRPVMMSIFLQALMLLTVHARLGTPLFRRVHDRAEPNSES